MGKSGKCLLLAVFSLIVVTTAFATKCNDMVTATNGTISKPEDAKKGTNCTVMILRKGDGLTTLRLQGLVIGATDRLVIYDGDAKDGKVLVEYNGDKGGFVVPFQIAVGFVENTTIIFIQGSDSSTSDFEILYDTTACKVNIEEQWMQLVSPVYVATPGKKFSCSYVMTKPLLADCLHVLSLQALSLTNKSSLVVSTNVGKKTTYQEKSDLHDFFPEKDATVMTLAFNIDDASTKQGATVIVETVKKSCSGEIHVNATMQVLSQYIPPTVVSPRECRWWLSSDKDPFLLNLAKLSLASAGDILSIIPGGSSLKPPVDTLTTSVDNYVLISPANSMILSLNLGHQLTERSINMQFGLAGSNKHFVGSGNFTLKTEKTAVEEVRVQMVASPQKLVQVSYEAIPVDAVLTFYQGLQKSAPLLANLTSKSPMVSPVIGGPQVLMVLSKVPAAANFDAKFTSIAAGCNMLSTESKGQMSLDEQTTGANATCTWRVSPVAAKGIIVVDTDAVNLGPGETVEMYAGLDDKARLVAKLDDKGVAPSMTGQARQVPQVYVDAGDGLKVVVKTGTATRNTTKFSMRYKVMESGCGGDIPAKTPATGMKLATPNFPNQYPLNAACTWSAKVANKIVYLNFDQLDLANTHSLQVLSMKNSTPTPVATYGYTDPPGVLPNDLLVSIPSELEITFQSQGSKATKAPQNAVGGGASLRYWILDCGGNLTSAKGTFQSPNLTADMLCVWTITHSAKDNMSYIQMDIKFDDKDKEVFLKSLTIFDGRSQRANVLPVNVTKGGLTSSRYPAVVLIFKYTAAAKTAKPKFSVAFSKIECPDEKDRCASSGICIHKDWLCNGEDNCGDNTDEKYCNGTQPMPPKEDHSGYVKSGWIAGSLVIGLVFGVVLALLVPKLIQRMRGGGGSSYSRMGDDRPVVT